MRTRTSSNRQYFLKNLKELIKKKEEKAAGKFPEDSLFFSKQHLEEGRRWKVKRKLTMTIKNQDLTSGIPAFTLEDIALNSDYIYLKDPKVRTFFIKGN